MKRRLNGVVALSVSLFLGTGSLDAQVAFGPVSGDAQKGAQLYYDHGCYGCHGYSGIGKKNLANDVSGIMFSEDVFLAYLRARADQNPVFPNSGMPNYSVNSLSDDSAKDIYAYIRTFKDDPPEMEDIPALKAILDDAKQEK